jgi:hypothetical protein
VKKREGSEPQRGTAELDLRKMILGHRKRQYRELF